MSFLFGLKAAQAKNRARAPGVNETRWLGRRGRRGSAQVLRLPCGEGGTAINLGEFQVLWGRLPKGRLWIIPNTREAPGSLVQAAMARPGYDELCVRVLTQGWNLVGGQRLGWDRVGWDGMYTIGAVGTVCVSVCANPATASLTCLPASCLLACFLAAGCLCLTCPLGRHFSAASHPRKPVSSPAGVPGPEMHWSDGLSIALGQQDPRDCRFLFRGFSAVGGQAVGQAEERMAGDGRGVWSSAKPRRGKATEGGNSDREPRNKKNKIK